MIMLYRLAMIFMIGLIIGNLIARFLIIRTLVKTVFDGYLLRPTI